MEAKHSGFIAPPLALRKTSKMIKDFFNKGNTQQIMEVEKWAPFEKQILGEYCSDTDESTDEEGEDVPTSDCPGITLRNIGESKMGGRGRSWWRGGTSASFWAWFLRNPMM